MCGRERQEAEPVEDAEEEALSSSEESLAMWAAPSIKRGPAGVQAPPPDLLPCLVDRLHAVPGTGTGHCLASPTGSGRRAAAAPGGGRAGGGRGAAASGTGSGEVGYRARWRGIEIECP